MSFSRLSAACGSSPRCHNEVAVEGLPDVRHEPPAVGIKPTQGQFFGDGGHVLGGLASIDLEAHQLRGLGYEVRLVLVKPGAPRLLLVIVAEDDQGRRGGGRRGGGGFLDRSLLRRLP